jgi:hypothetical protein
MANSIDRLNVGNLSAQRFTPPAGSIANAAIADGADIDASKLEGEYRHTLTLTGAVTAQTVYVTVIRGAQATLLTLAAAITEVVATGADRTVTIDLQKSTGGGAFATVLTGTLVFDDSSILRTVDEASVATPGLVAGDILKLTVAVAGAAGAQAQGLACSVTWNEDAA